ncbi:uncharacterized protein EDB91DRAFT_130383 [Suillus paluster]|uniref:uncharacterized protein n=1 Tax=Suillus paluster TaxID=48578 RepID=UPI001B85B993|nr:uncharacterized protein EDB91DRAFT_130383 [Suillus paluster]KAG1745900.1 hypothetical protein EDB91DRAFT_130383 [Suillus paluster]
MKPVTVRYRRSSLACCSASLKKLRISHIGILYVHWWDWDTSVEEVMNGLHLLVQQAKVLCLVSRTLLFGLYPKRTSRDAWNVMSRNFEQDIVPMTRFSPFHSQSAWNVISRDFERDTIPIARAEGLAFAPRNVLAGRKLRTGEEERHRRQTGEKGRTLTNPN